MDKSNFIADCAYIYHVYQHTFPHSHSIIINTWFDKYNSQISAINSLCLIFSCTMWCHMIIFSYFLHTASSNTLLLVELSARGHHIKPDPLKCDLVTVTDVCPDGSHLSAMIYSTLIYIITQQTQNICITFIQCWTNVEDVGPTLYKCYTNVLCLLGTESPALWA